MQSMKSHVAYCIDLYSLSVWFWFRYAIFVFNFQPCRLCSTLLSVDFRKTPPFRTVCSYFVPFWRSCDITLWSRKSTNDLTFQIWFSTSVWNHDFGSFFCFQTTSTWPLIRFEFRIPQESLTWFYFVIVPQTNLDVKNKSLVCNYTKGFEILQDSCFFKLKALNCLFNLKVTFEKMFPFTLYYKKKYKTMRRMYTCVVHCFQ